MIKIYTDGSCLGNPGPGGWAAVIIFDDMFNFVGWKEGEYKALNEVFDESEYDFKAFNFSDSQVVIQKK